MAAVGIYSGFWQLQMRVGQRLETQADTEQSVWLTVHNMVVVSHVLGAQSVVVMHEPPLTEQTAGLQVPGPQVASEVHKVAVQPSKVGVLQMLVRLSHLAGAVSGISPQQSALVEHSWT
jgi:hypothetical protein